MASTVERERTEVATKATASSGKQHWARRILAPRPVPARNATTGGQAKKGLFGGSFRFFLAMIIFLFGSEFLGSVLQSLDTSNHWHLETIHIASPNTFLLGGLNALVLVYFAMAVALWALLYFTRIMPRDPFGAKAAAQARAERAAAKNPVVSTGPSRTRAQRRANASVTASAVVPAETTRVAGGAHDNAYEQIRAQQKRARRRQR